MKRFLLFTFLLMLFTNSIAAATTGVYILNDPEPPGPRPRSLICIPVTKTISETDLSVYFKESVGIATITVFNASSQIVEQKIVNTNTTTEVCIPIYSWDSGDYTLTITYGNTTLSSEFTIP